MCMDTCTNRNTDMCTDIRKEQYNKRWGAQAPLAVWPPVLRRPDVQHEPEAARTHISFKTRKKSIDMHMHTHMYSRMCRHVHEPADSEAGKRAGSRAGGRAGGRADGRGLTI